jgi:hypothetical protein
VHRASQAPPPAIEAHFSAVTALLESLARRPDAEYVASFEGWIWRPIASSAIFEGEDVVAAYETEERSIDPLVVAAELRSAARASPRLTVLTGLEVSKVREGRGAELRVESASDGRTRGETYDAVVNALWQNRLAVDHGLGLDEGRAVLHRFKIGLHSKPSFEPGDLPSVTFVLGPFGDTVNFGRRAYLSWYPAGHVHTSRERSPARSDDDLLGSDLEPVENATIEALSHLLRSHREVLRRSRGQWHLGGAYITAWGRTDIDDQRSQLHQRFEVGVHSRGTYHSIDTGKYTLGPHFAERACDRIAPRAAVSLPATAARH